MRILYMGTPDFAVVCLEALCKSGHEIVGVVSQPDKPKGRGHKVVPTPVKACATEHGLCVYAPETLKDGAFMEVLEKTKPDLIVVVAYGQILPEYVLNYPEYGCINVHASLLPKYRGAAPIQWSIINGEKVTGITTMYMEKGLDTGDMLLSREVSIDSDTTAEILHDKLAVVGAEVLVETIEAIRNGTLKPVKQDDSLSCYAPMIDKNTALIDWSKSADEIKNLVMGMNSYPLAYSYYQGKMMKIALAKTVSDNSDAKCGQILSVRRGEGIKVKCGKDALIITHVKFEGKKLMSVDDYLSGHSIETGEIIGG